MVTLLEGVVAPSWGAMLGPRGEVPLDHLYGTSGCFWMSADFSAFKAAAVK